MKLAERACVSSRVTLCRLVLAPSKRHGSLFGGNSSHFGSSVAGLGFVVRSTGSEADRCPRWVTSFAHAAAIARNGKKVRGLSEPEFTDSR